MEKVERERCAPHFAMNPIYIYLLVVDVLSGVDSVRIDGF